MSLARPINEEAKSVAEASPTTFCRDTKTDLETPSSARHQMKRSTLVALTIVLSLTLSTIPTDASKMSVTVDAEKIHVKIESVVTQNFTALAPVEFSVNGESLTKTQAAIDNATKAKQRNAETANLAVSVQFTEASIRVKTEFDILGVVLVKGSILAANTSWRSFDVSENVSAQGVYWNRVGEAYLVPAVDRFVDVTGAQFYTNRTILTGTYQAKQTLRNLRMLDFKALATPLHHWNMARSLREGKTVWRLSVGTVFDLSVRDKDSAGAEHTVLRTLDAEISAPGYASLEGETVRTDLGTGMIELAMLIVVLSTFFGAVLTHLFRKTSRKR